MSRKVATLSTLSEQDGLSNPQPRIYHYPTKFRKQLAPAIPRVSVEPVQSYTRYDPPAHNDYVPRTERLSANPGVATHTDGANKSGTMSYMQSYVTNLRQNGLSTPKLSPSFWNVPAVKNITQKASPYYLLILLPFLILLLSHLLTPSNDNTTVDYKLDQAIANQNIDPEELKAYIRQLVAQYAQEGQSSWQQAQTVLSDHTKTLHNEITTIKDSIDKLGSDQKDNKAADNTKLQDLQDKLKGLEARISELHTQQVTIAEVRRVAAENNYITPADLDKLKDEVLAKIASGTATQQGNYVTPAELEKLKEEVLATRAGSNNDNTKYVTPEEFQKLKEDVFSRIPSSVARQVTPEELEKLKEEVLAKITSSVGTNGAAPVSDYDISQEVRKQVLAERDALKEDIQKEIRGDLNGVKDSLKADIDGIKSSIQVDLTTVKEGLKEDLQNGIKESEDKWKSDVAEKLRAHEQKVTDALDSASQKLRSEFDEKATKEEHRNNLEIEALTQQIKTLRDKLQEVPTTTTTSSDEISPKVRDLVKELLKENLPAASQISEQKQSGLDEAAVNKLIDTATERLATKVDNLSSKTEGAEAVILSKLDGVISEKLSALPRDALTTSQLDKLKSQITVELLAQVAEKVLAEVKEMLARYDADKNGRIDWALATVGTRIVHSRTSETYSPTPKNQTTYEYVRSLVFGNPRGFGPTAILTRDVTTGHCWAFEGTRGHVTVKLAPRPKPIHITHVSIDHLSPLIAPNITSAPKDCIVYGMADENAPRVELGKFTFDAYSSELLQTFELENPGAYPYVMLDVTSNHGFEEYTCIYRFRIHGDELDSYTQ